MKYHFFSTVISASNWNCPCFWSLYSICLFWSLPFRWDISPITHGEPRCHAHNRIGPNKLTRKDYLHKFVSNGLCSGVIKYKLAFSWVRSGAIRFLQRQILTTHYENPNSDGTGCSQIQDLPRSTFPGQCVVVCCSV